MQDHRQEARSVFILGLKNAHAMENQALGIMRPQVERTEDYPAVQQRLKQHISETESQIGRLEQVRETMDEHKSAFKDMTGSAMGTMASLGHVAAGDEILKNSFANSAFENYEIAAYKSLITLADEAGVASAASLLKQNLAEEEAMADWLDQHLAEVTRQYVAHRGSTTSR